jgi:hypothetical protein
MIRISILPLVVLVAATAVLAQQTVTADRTNGIVLSRHHPLAPDCPLGMHASHGTGLPVAMSAGPARNNPMAGAPALVQEIHLTMTNPLSHEIVGAQFVVHGFSAKWRAMNLADSSQAPDLTKTMDMVVSVKGKGQASRDLSLRRFAAVTSIDLTAITYADGSTWQTPSAAACSVTPDMVMLVASTQ